MERRSESGGSEPPPDKTISAGDRIGRFEIIGPLGAGGMGEVYRARDPQLRREVAIKIQSEEFGSDPERQYRFEREARAAASLNHPNVIAVHDFGIHQGIAFLVTELLDGGTLRQRMGGRPLPARAAVDYAIQLFNGLAAGNSLWRPRNIHRPPRFVVSGWPLDHRRGR